MEIEYVDCKVFNKNKDKQLRVIMTPIIYLFCKKKTDAEIKVDFNYDKIYLTMNKR